MFKNLFGGKKEKYYRQIDENQQDEPAKVETPAPAKEASQAKAKPASSKKTSVANNGKAAPAKTVAAAPASKPAVSDPEAIIRAAVSKNTSNGKVEAKKVDFASTNEISPTMSRRRPGPSLNMFKDMARQAKVPNK
jgi:hypothetical protein